MPNIFSLSFSFDYPTGYFEIGGCEGVNPTLHLTVGRTYLFDQSHGSNWYHLIGFACKFLDSEINISLVSAFLTRK